MIIIMKMMMNADEETKDEEMKKRKKKGKRMNIIVDKLYHVRLKYHNNKRTLDFNPF